MSLASFMIPVRPRRFLPNIGGIKELDKVVKYMWVCFLLVFGYVCELKPVLFSNVIESYKVKNDMKSFNKKLDVLKLL